MSVIPTYADSALAARFIRRYGVAPTAFDRKGRPAVICWTLSADNMNFPTVVEVQFYQKGCANQPLHTWFAAKWNSYSEGVTSEKQLTRASPRHKDSAEYLSSRITGPAIRFLRKRNPLLALPFNTFLEQVCLLNSHYNADVLRLEDDVLTLGERRYSILSTPQGTLLTLESAFVSDTEGCVWRMSGFRHT